MEKKRVNPWLEKSKQNLLPLSINNEFKLACAEWEFTGEVIDHVLSEESCELCEHEELRYHYKIVNGSSNHSLWVGSSCILRFQEIVVYDSSRTALIDKSERTKALKQALKEQQKEMSLEPMRSLWLVAKSERNFIFWMAQNIKNAKSHSPDNLLKLFQLMKKFQIEYQADLYKVTLRSLSDSYELRMMGNNDLNIIWPCLSSKQKELFLKWEESVY